MVQSPPCDCAPASRYRRQDSNVITDICDVRYLPPPCDMHGEGKGNIASPQQKRRIGY